MTDQIKHLAFKGIEKKEQILFKSFLNLAKNDLSYQLVVLKDRADEDQAPDILVVDETFSFEGDAAALQNLPSIVIGDDTQRDSPDYIQRPAQWSDFKAALSKLTTDINIEEVVAEQEQDRILPDAEKIELEVVEDTISDYDTVSEFQTVDNDNDSDDGGDVDVVSETTEEKLDMYDHYELDHMSVDYNDLTNSEYLKVVDDVIQYKNEDEDVVDEEDELKGPVILVSDDESASSNSVLVIETNSMDAWDFNEFELEEKAEGETATDSFAKFKKAMGVEEPEEVTEDEIPIKVGNNIGLDEEYWAARNEIIANGESFLFFIPEENLVYSSQIPAKWPPVLKRGVLTKNEIGESWQQTSDLKPYSIDTFLWTYILVTDIDELYEELDDDQPYMLESWPSFDLLELDNILLKLCAMLFVRPETVGSLAQKSGYGRSTVCGLMNACHKYGFLKVPEDISTGVPTNTDESMLGKIRDVFR